MLGKRPSNVDSASIEKIVKDGQRRKFGFLLTVNGEEQEYMFCSARTRGLRYREYKTGVEQATDA